MFEIKKGRDHRSEEDGVLIREIPVKKIPIKTALVISKDYIESTKDLGDFARIRELKIRLCPKRKSKYQSKRR